MARAHHQPSRRPAFVLPACLKPGLGPHLPPVGAASRRLALCALAPGQTRARSQARAPLAAREEDAEELHGHITSLAVKKSCAPAAPRPLLSFVDAQAACFWLGLK